MANFYQECFNEHEIETFTTDYPCDQLYKLFELVFQQQDKRKKNYTVENSFKDYALCYTLTTVDGEPYLGSMAWNRPFYNGMIRVATRYCVNPKWINDFYYKTTPGKGHNNMRIDAIDHIDQQVDFGQKQGFTNFFFSREDKTNGKRTQKICEMVNQYSKYSWKMLEEKQLVCPDPKSNSCWQFVVYNNEPFLRSKK